jgi:ureidoglycolate lyase
MQISAKPLTAKEFAPFGHVFSKPTEIGRIYASEALTNGRVNAKPSLSIAKMVPMTAPVLTAVKMERHEFSSQSFVPVDVSRYLVLVAPHGPGNRPDVGKLKAFIARGDQGVTYGINVWHHPMSVLDRPAMFAIMMWLEGNTGDEEFVDLPAPLTITFPENNA